MKSPDWLRILTASPRQRLPGGVQLRLLTAQEVLEARRAATALAGRTRPGAVLQRLPGGPGGGSPGASGVWVRGGGSAQADGGPGGNSGPPVDGVLPGGGSGDRTGEEPAGPAKKSLEHMPRQRLRWHVLKCFGALPTEERAKAMREEDYLWCAVNLLLDEEEVARQLCPQCREAAERARCPVCGRESGEMVREENPTFDWARFQALKEGACD
ncbi:MAG: hypothetical protein ACLRWL_11585 [Evtepia gabavorous]